MVALSTLVLTYVIGGITFVPICVLACFALVFYTSPVVLKDPPRTPPSCQQTRDDEINPDEQEPVTVYRAGWITARRTFEPVVNSNGDHSATYVGMLANGYRSFMDNRSKETSTASNASGVPTGGGISAAKRSATAMTTKDRFFAVLKQNILFLYESETQQECWAAIEVSSHDVVVYPEGNVDGEFWVKRTAIELKPKARRSSPGRGVEDEDETDESGKVEGQAQGTNYDAETGKPLPWFIFAKVNSDKEDWYHSLVIASRIGTPTCAADTARDRALFSSDDMAHLIDSIDSLPDSIPMRWFNAVLGRVFLAVYRTNSLESYIISRIVRKLKRVKIPSILSEIQVREVDVGSSTPLFSKPMLKELTTEGEASMEVHVSYIGAVRITIETVATVSISSRFKPYSVRLVLAVVLEELEGTLLLKIKKPPSNRIWFGFTTMPKIKMAIEPLVSTRQIKWSMITSPIESRIREVIAESVVLPHMDDLSFFSTLPFPATARGGIFGAALRQERPDLNVPATIPSEMATATSPEAAKTDQDLVSLGATSNADLKEGDDATESKKERAKLVEGVLLSEGKETMDRARQRVRRPSSSSSLLNNDEERDVLNRHHQFDATARSPSKRPSSIKSTSSATSTSVSTLAGLASAKIASWREKKEDPSLGEGLQRGGADKKRTSSWFAKGNNSSSSASSTGTFPQSSVKQDNEGHLDADRRANTADANPLAALDNPEPTRPDPVRSDSTVSTTTHHEEISAAKLREILTKRAESRERERKEKEDALLEEEGKFSKVLPPDSIVDVGNSALVSNLTRTAPTNILKPLPSIAVDSSPSSTDSQTTVLPIPASPASLDTDTSLPSHMHDVPPLPARPAWIKPTESSETAVPDISSTPSSLPPPPPPIRRSPSHNASASVDSPSTSQTPNGNVTTTSLLTSWRAKAADKEALAQSVAQAKESMRKWGAGWNARRTASRPADAEGAGLLSLEEKQQAATTNKKEDEEHYRDYRKRAGKSGVDEASYYAPDSREPTPPQSPRRPPHTKSASTASPSRMRASSIALSSSTLENATAEFDSTASTSTSPTAKLAAVQQSVASKPLPVPSLSTSPSKSPGAMSTGARIGGAGGGYGYGPATMMQLPGIRDEGRKKLVREDHLGGGETAAVAIVETEKVEGRTQPRDETESSVRDSRGSTKTLAKTEVVVVPVPSSTIEHAIEPERPSSTVPSLPPRPDLPPRVPTVPTLPPRSLDDNDSFSPTKVPPVVPARLETATDTNPKDASADDVLLDEAGWGLTADKNEKLT